MGVTFRAADEYSTRILGETFAELQQESELDLNAFVLLIDDPFLLSDPHDIAVVTPTMHSLAKACRRLEEVGGGSIVVLINHHLLQGDTNLPAASAQAASAAQSVGVLARTYGAKDIRINAVTYEDLSHSTIPTLWLISAAASYVTGQSLYAQLPL